MNRSMSSVDEYEYEYSDTQTETFYIDLDLSSMNDVIKSRNASDRKTLRSLQKTSGNTQTDQDGVAGREEGTADNQQELDTVVGHTSPHSAAGEEGRGKLPEVELDGLGDNVQILELHSKNPIVSYRNAIYGCTWTDMIGTNMFFTKHNEVPMHEPELATEDYDMIGTSRIKFVGRKAKVTPKSQVEAETRSSSQLQSRKRTHTEQEAGEEEQIHDQDESTASATHTANNENNENTSTPGDPSAMLPPNYNPTSFRRTNPQAQTQAKKQAQFLEKLKAIKKQRGERDTVRTFVDRHTLEAAEKQREEMIKMRKEIDRLNKRVVRGDKKALQRLQEIYSHMEEVESDDDDVFIIPAAETTSGDHERRAHVNASNTRPEGSGTRNEAKS